ncbi:MAG: DUF4129 domain-containing protein, partial [Anaerolineales bacterium]
YGWVEFEPTPARAPWVRPAGASVVETPAAAAAPLAPQRRGLAPWLVGVLAAAALALGGWWLYGRPNAAGGDPRGRAVRLYQDELRWLALAGLGARPADTPDEFLRASSAALTSRPALLAALSRATDLYRRAAYSPHPVSAAETHSARRLWSAARLPALQLLARRLLRGRPMDNR